MKKKAMALLLTAAMAASVLTGCGRGGGGGAAARLQAPRGGRRTPAQRRSLRLMERRPQTRARKPGMTASTMWTRTGTSTRSSTTSS